MTEPSIHPKTPDPPAAPAELPGLNLLFAIRKNWLIAVALTLVFGIGAAFYTFGQTRIYESTAVILFNPVTPQPLGNEVQSAVDLSAQYWNNREYYKTQFWIIRSQQTALAVVRELGLNTDPAFIGLGRRSMTPEDAAARVRAGITVEPIKESRLAEVRYRDTDPRRAQRIVSSVVDNYVQGNLTELTEAGNQAADWLRNQVTSLKQELEQSEMALHEYKLDKNILSVSMDDQTNMLRDEMTQLNTALGQVKTHREEVRARRAELMGIKSADPMNVPVTELLQSSMLQTLRQSYVDATRNFESLLGQGKGESHPDVKAALAGREATRKALMDEIGNVRGALDRDLAGLDREADGLQKLLSDAEKQALDLNLLEIEYNRLRRAKDNNEKLFSLVTERSKETDLTKMLRINNVRLVQRAEVPRLPVVPNVPMNLASGVLAGLVLGLAAAIGREQLDRSIKNPDDLERVLGLSFLGFLPSLESGKKKRHAEAIAPVELAEGKPELFVHDHPTSGIAEAARAIRTNILFMSPDRPYKTLLVTSAGPAEGKTTVACCIAIAMAQAGRKVVLVDCDMRRPRLHQVFGAKRDEGITTALLDLPNIGDALLTTPVPNLHLIPAGPLPPNPAEILHSESFTRFLRALRDRYDCVIIDSPPVVAVTDAAVLSTSVDGTVLVVRAFQTSKDMARRASRALADVGVRLVGTVLNGVDVDRDGYAYGYYYYHREGYAQQSPAEEQRRAV